MELSFVSGNKAWKKYVAAGLTAAALGLLSALPAFAAGGLDVSVTYPGILVKPGDSFMIPVTISNTTGSAIDADLKVSDLPDGFDAYLQGGSFRINRIHVLNGQDQEISLRLSVPADADQENYDFSVEASTKEGAADKADIRITLGDREESGGMFTAEYARQAGTAGTTFSFSTTLANNGMTTQSYNFSDNLPEGWTISYFPKGERTAITGIDLESGASKGITVSVVSPQNCEAGVYDIPISVVSSGETLQTTLQAEITGSYGIKLESADELLSFDAYAGKDHDLNLKITNNGNVDLANVSLNAETPSGWTVTYDADSNVIGSIPAGSTAEVTAHVKPASNAVTGDYALTFTASNDNASSTAAFRVSIKTGTAWGAAAAAVIIAVFAGLGFVFHKYGRR